VKEIHRRYICKKKYLNYNENCKNCKKKIVNVSSEKGLLKGYICYGKWKKLNPKEKM
jgi:hypothetical protein